MNKKKIIILVGSIVLLVIIIVIGIKISNDNKKKNEGMKVINDSYKDLANRVIEYNNIREEYLEISKKFYYETFMDKHDEYLNVLDRYDKIIAKVEEDISKIDDKCVIKYNDSNTDRICNNYKELYEKLVNLYVMDLNNYNEIVDGYNEYKNNNVSKYEGKFKEYIDFNNDKKYEGIDNNEESES